VITILFTILCGIVFPIGGCAMQHSWKNQLGDVYSVGLGSAACLGGAAACVFGFPIYVGALGACLLSTLIAGLVCRRVKISNFITFGILFGSIIGSCGTIVANNASPESLQAYYHWSSSSYYGIPLWQLLIPLVLIPFPLVRIVMKETSKTETFVLVSLMISLLLPAVGFVGMISLLAPNLSRIIKPNAPYRLECAISAAIGVGLLGLTNLLIFFNPFGIYLPASATMSLIAVPLLFLTFRK